MSDVNQTYRLRWNNESSAELNLSDAFRDLRDSSDFFDVAIGCSIASGGSKTLRAHKVILSAYSAVFKEMFRQHPNRIDPFIYLKGVSHLELSHLLDFMYNGEVNIKQSNLSSFLAVAEELQIKGLQTTNKRPKPPTSAPQQRPSDGMKAIPQGIQRYMKQEKQTFDQNNNRSDPININYTNNDEREFRTLYASKSEANVKEEEEESDGEPTPEDKIGNVEDFVKKIDKHFMSGGQKRQLSICRICRKEIRSDRIKKHIRGVHKKHILGMEHILTPKDEPLSSSSVGGEDDTLHSVADYLNEDEMQQHQEASDDLQEDSTFNFEAV